MTTTRETKTVIVTGATGHLGRYVVDELARAGFDVVAASRGGAVPPPPFGAVAPAPVRTLALDVADDGAVAALAAALATPAAIVHLAAWHPPATAASTAADRRGLIETNVLGTQRVLDAARARDVDVVVYASSFEIYGLPTRPGPVAEDDPTQPMTDYGATKLAGEDHLYAFAAETGRRAVALRLPAVYGPDERVARALPNFLRRVAAGERPVIHGDGTDRRDRDPRPRRRPGYRLRAGRRRHRCLQRVGRRPARDRRSGPHGDAGRGAGRRAGATPRRETAASTSTCGSTRPGRSWDSPPGSRWRTEWPKSSPGYAAPASSSGIRSRETTADGSLRTGAVRLVGWCLAFAAGEAWALGRGGGPAVAVARRFGAGGRRAGRPGPLADRTAAADRSRGLARGRARRPAVAPPPSPLSIRR